jgi:hypothetical protein
VHLDTAWFEEDWNPDFLFSEERFPEPEKKMAALLEKGIHVSLWQYKYEYNYLLYLMLLTYILALFRQGKTIYYSVKQ